MANKVIFWWPVAFLTSLAVASGGTDGLIDEIFATQRANLSRIESTDMVYFEDWKPSESLVARGVPSYLQERHVGFRYQREGAKYRIETGIDGTLDNRPNSWRTILAFDLKKTQFFRKDSLALRVQNKQCNPADEYNLPYLRPYRFLFLHQAEFSSAQLQDPATWNDLKTRVSRAEEANVGGHECVVMQIDCPDKNVSYKASFAKDLAYYPVSVQVFNQARKTLTTEVTVNEIQQYETQNGLVVLPLVVTQVNSNEETGKEMYRIKYSVDLKRLSINEDIPDEVFTIPLHMAREYEDADDDTQYYNADDIADRGLANPPPAAQSKEPKVPAGEPSEKGAHPSGELPPKALAVEVTESASPNMRLIACIFGVISATALIGYRTYRHRKKRNIA
jgi:hypothetical protein